MNRTIQRIVGLFAILSLTLGLFTPAGASSVSIPHAAGNTYFVSVSGSDLNNCTQSAPCKSFNKAMSLIQSGDVLYVMPGTYNQTLTISKSRVTVEGNKAVIDTTGTFGIRVASTAQNVVVRGFTVTRANSHAIYVEGQFVTIENNVVYHSVLENGTLLNGVISCRNGSWGSAIKVKVGGENVIIRNNEVFDNCGEGIAATRGVNVLIEGNRVYDNHSVNIYVDNSINTQVLNNHSFCKNRDTSPIAVGEEYYDGWGAQLRDVVIKDNRIEGCQRAIIVYGSGVGGTLTNALIDNNIVASGTGTRSVISLDNQRNSNVRITNNQLWKLNIWVRSPAGVTLENNSVGGALPTVTNTPVSVIATRTPIPIVTQSWTATSTPISSPTSVPPSATPILPPATSTPFVMPTFTHTSIPPTALPSATPVLPSATSILPPATSTPFVMPTFTHTSIPPTSLPSATPDSSDDPEPIETEPSEKIFDDKDGAFEYSRGWDDIRRRKAHGGSYKMTTRNGAFVTFTFTGESFSVLYLAGSEFKSIDVYVDDVLVGTIKDKGKNRRFHQRWDYSGKLETGVHTLKLVFNLGRSRNSSGTLDAVIVR
ncbi:MAG: right-handed parallel beta-helix repeat-containing protein [Anaerolineales bacterium]|nr:right-handed parallel beta-helix repeat-containing protein [Anaerolineales bacterium]